MNELYPLHFKALKVADLVPKEIPTMKNILQQVKSSEQRKKEKEEKDGRRKNLVKPTFALGEQSV